jgi:transcriptional regulator with XRE-family HTH domain
MATAINQQTVLIESLKKLHNLKNDAALSRALGVAPPLISKVKSGVLTIGDSLLIKIHDAFDMPIKEIRALYLPDQENGSA